MAFDLSGIIQQDCSAVHRWMIDTFVMAMLSSGKEADEQVAFNMAREQVIDFLPADNLNAGSITPRVIEIALELCGGEKGSDFDTANREQLQSVNCWIMRTLAMSHVARQRPFTGEGLECEADVNIVGPVQGNRSEPRGVDLDCLVQRTLEYVAGQFNLKIEPVAV